MDFQSVIAAAPLTVLVTGGFLVFLILVSLFRFFIPGLRQLIRLRNISSSIGKLKKKNQVEDFKRIFGSDKELSHLWSEFQESLHPVEEFQDGQLIIKEYRATAPAEMYFHGQSVVDGRLHTEFFKHLPGIFTGLGIIGTFSGLIQGLRAFQVSENAATVRGSLESLMHAVGDAFLVSAGAITAAMLVTFLEKFLLNALYRKTDEIVRAIDECFESGVGEHYLGRLVRASEDSASQSKILKDALVKDLGELLRELTAAQISASERQQEQLGTTIAESIKQSLETPLQEIANTVKTASGDQSSSAVNMLQDVMVSFSQRLNDLFGGQISGLNELNQQTAQSIQNAVGTLQTLVSNIEDSSRRSTDAMAERMAQAIEKMEARQQAMNTESTDFVQQIRELVASSQSETNQKLQATLETIGTQMAGMLERLNESQAQVFENNQAREQSMTDRTSHAVNKMSESIDNVVMNLNDATSQMAQNIAMLSQTTSSSVDKLHAGADKLGRASQDFATAGDRVSDVITKTAAVSAQFSETSGALTVGGSAMQELIKDYRTQKTLIETMVTELRLTVEAARREASLTGDILQRIEGATQKLGTAQKQADEYLDGVSKVLGEAHTSFATEVKRTLDKANSEFHTKLSSAVGLLNSSIGELEITLASMGTISPAKK